MPRGYYNEEGDFIEDSHTIANAVMFPSESKHGLYCTGGHYMKLYPVSHDLPAKFWSCPCKSISIEARDQCFDNYTEIFGELYNLKSLTYDIENRNWEIESSEWIGESRIGAKRKRIGPTERQEIIDQIHEVIEKELHISFEDFDEYFNTQ